MYVNGENWTSVGVPDVTGDSPLPDAPGCSYTALDDIAIWSRPLSEDDMMVLRLDRFNETEIMTTTQQETTTSGKYTCPGCWLFINTKKHNKYTNRRSQFPLYRVQGEGEGAGQTKSLKTSDL